MLHIYYSTRQEVALRWLMQNEKGYFSILYTFFFFCINARPFSFASQPASFNQVHQTSVNPITMGE